MPGSSTAAGRRPTSARPTPPADAVDALAMAQLLQGSRPWSFRTGLARLQLARLAEAKGDVDAARREAAAALPHLEYNLDAGHSALAQVRMLAGQGAGD